jgi:hypothetical protein
MTRIRSTVIVLSVLVLVASCGGNGESSDSAETETSESPFIELPGPFPMTIEGDFEIAEVSDAGGDDYMAFGWIKTSQGDVGVYAYGRVLKAGGTEEGGVVSAVIEPGRGIPGSYEITEISLKE